MPMKALAVCGILALAASWMDAQVVLSRRVYAEHGRTFPQIWVTDVGTGKFRQLTHSAREHSDPVCSRDGALIYFISDRDVERSRNAYGGPAGREVWAYNRRTGEERFVWRTSQDLGLHLAGITADGGVLLRVGSELRSLSHNPWVIDKVDEVAVSLDGRKLALVIAESHDQQGQSRNARLFLADAATGKARIEVGNYGRPEWSPDGMRIAAFFDGGLVILNATNRKEIERVGLPKRDARHQDIVWSPDGKSLLIGLYGENGGAGDPQSDYFLLNPATRTWTPKLTARQILWRQGESILYLRPFSITPLAPASRHSVWTSQLAIYNLASNKDAALSSGLALNDQLAACGH